MRDVCHAGALPDVRGAIINARIKTLVFGAYDPKAGSIDSVVNLCDLPYNHKPKFTAALWRTSVLI